MNPRSKQSGFILIDVLAGIFLLAALSTAMMVAINVRNRAAIKFADQRQAIELARQTLADLQANHPPPNLPNARISISPTTQPARDLRWVRVTVELNGRSATLAGAVPATQPGEKQ